MQMPAFDFKGFALSPKPTSYFLKVWDITLVAMILFQGPAQSWHLVTAHEKNNVSEHHKVPRAGLHSSISNP